MPKTGLDRKQEVCIVTGLSGAGKSTALRVFEDLGYFVVAGLPAVLADEMAAMLLKPSMRHFCGIVLGMDLRQDDFLHQLQLALEQLKKRDLQIKLLFIEASNEALLRRYATTRRPHPLEREGKGLEAAIEAEKESLMSLRNTANLIIDTTNFSIHDLRRIIQQHWWQGEALHQMKINLLSFGFKHSFPADVDWVIDVRFLANPYFVEGLKEKTGLEAEVADYVFALESAKNFRSQLSDLLLFTLPLLESEGRYRVSIAIGCTGGKHRSVAMVEYLGQILRQAGYIISIEHRHLNLE